MIGSRVTKKSYKMKHWKPNKKYKKYNGEAGGKQLQSTRGICEWKAMIRGEQMERVRGGGLVLKRGRL